MLEYERIGRELVYDGTIVNVYKDKMKNADGSVSDWDFIEHPGAAATVAVDGDGKIILVRQLRPALGRYTIELPAGGKNPEEDFETCALRELEEETGMRAGKSELLCDIYTTVALMNERIPIYLATDLVPTHQHLDENELLNVERHDLDELVQMIFEGKLQDSKTICGILAYKAKKGL
ncbi:MAG: NUDIX hydrolase [Lachnospiraceae bacterium]|nr:NUDIX hydrolase [Lachnospiraceae bacterium]